MQQESFLMRLCRRAGLEKLAWSLRRFYCPVDANDLVLEVGSGGNPYHRANVLLDAYEVTRERHWAPLVTDRPTVLGFVENLPFKDKSFDFVIASHVLEHSTDPAHFLSELQRVAKAGYIEVPDAFMERINPYKDHRLEITVRNGRLIIRNKNDWKADSELVELYEARAKHWVTRDLIPSHPFDFHVRYYWSDKIDFEILNPSVNANWEAPPVSSNLAERSYKFKFKELVRKMGQRILTKKMSNNINLFSLLRCPSCYSGNIECHESNVVCMECNLKFPIVSGVPRMFAINTSSID